MRGVMPVSNDETFRVRRSGRRVQSFLIPSCGSLSRSGSPVVVRFEKVLEHVQES